MKIKSLNFQRVNSHSIVNANCVSIRNFQFQVVEYSLGQFINTAIFVSFPILETKYEFLRRERSYWKSTSWIFSKDSSSNGAFAQLSFDFETIENHFQFLFEIQILEAKYKFLSDGNVWLETTYLQCQFCSISILEAKYEFLRRERSFWRSTSWTSIQVSSSNAWAFATSHFLPYPILEFKYEFHELFLDEKAPFEPSEKHC